MVSSAPGFGPPPPPRISSGGTTGVRFGSVVHWRESLAVLLCYVLGGVILISVLVLAVYGLRYRAVYEELVDYLDKTISISKINYNHLLGLYELNEKELNVLGYHRSYKTTLWAFLAADLGSYVFLAVAVLLYYSTDISRGPFHILFWAIFALGVFYSVVEAHVFSFMLFPYSSSLANSTEQLLNHAIPHNPGGLLPMELRLGCTFELNLYASNRRTQNPRNTCDPQITGSFISRILLSVLLMLRLIPIILFALIAARHTAVGQKIADLIDRTRPTEGTRKFTYQKNKSNIRADPPKTTTTYGAANRNTPLPPPLPPVGQIDHNISYNNAAYFATNGGIASSRSSDISRLDAADLYNLQFQAKQSHQQQQYRL